MIHLKIRIFVTNFKILSNVIIQHWGLHFWHSVRTSEIGFPIISLEPISERSTLKYFHEPSMQLVRIDVIGTFWRATTRELYDKTWIVLWIESGMQWNLCLCSANGLSAICLSKGASAVRTPNFTLTFDGGSDPAYGQNNAEFGPQYGRVGNGTKLTRNNLDWVELGWQ